MKKLLTLMTLLVFSITSSWGAITAHDLSSSNFTKTFTQDDNGTISAGAESWGMYFKVATSVANGKLNFPSSNIGTSNNFISIPLTGIAKGKVISVVIAASAKMKLAVDEKTSYTANISSSLTEVALINSAITYNYTMTGDGGNAVLYFGRSGTNGTITSITIKVADPIENPVFTYATGTYYTGLVPTISCATEGATIYYKNADKSDRKDITTMSSEGGLGGAITSGKTFSAYALKDGVYSDIVKATYTIEDCPTSLTVDPAEGTYNSAQNVTFTSTLRSNGVIKYTTNGSSPSWSSTSYDGTPIAVSATTTIKARVFETTGSGSKKSTGDIVFTYTIVSLTDPVFSLSATTIPSNSTAQIKVGDNDGLDGVTLSNIAYGTDGIVTVNATTGVVTPVTAGTTTITFDTDATVKYNSSTGNEFTITVTTPKCATPTITKGGFNFENKGYAVTITNNEDGSTLYYSTNNEDWTEYTDVLYATTTTHYYAKSVKASYDDSEVADEIVTFTFDGGKKYIAWVYKDGYSSASVSYDFDTDPMVIGLKTVYNVVPVALSDSDKPYTNRDTDGYGIDHADLIVCTEAVTGNTNMANDMVNFVGNNAMINLKLWNYGNGNGTQTRWGWGTVANNTTSFTFTPTSPTYKIFSGVTFEDGDVRVFESTAPKDNKLAYVNWTSEPANNVVMGSVSDKPTMHAIIDDANLGKQFFAIGLSRDNATSYSANAVTIIKNVAAMLIAGTERIDAEVVSVSGTITEAGWSTFSCSYPLDLSTITGGAAYVATTNDNTEVTLTETSAKVAAGTGLMIKGTAGETFTIGVTSDAATLTRDNLLVGLPNGGTVTAGDYNYVFAWTTGDVSTAGFWYVNDAEPTLGAGKAYLHSVGGNGAKLNIIIDNGETTSISEELRVKSEESSSAYNLAGQKVGADYKGIVIVNGKKFLRK